MAENPVKETIDLGSPLHVLAPMPVRAMVIALLGATGLATVLLSHLPHLLGLPIILIAGWRLSYAVYEVVDPTSGRHFLMDMWWNHAILIAVLLLCGIWAGILIVGVSGLPSQVHIEWLFSLPKNCAGRSSPARDFLSAMVVGSVIMSAVAGLLVTLYFVNCWKRPRK